MTDELSDYRHLWDGSEKGWALLPAREVEGGYCVFNKAGYMLVIESEEINAAVCRRMIEAGCEILDELPR